MANKAVVKERSALAASFSWWATRPDAERDVFDFFEIPEGEDLQTVPAAPSESAALTLHRLERSGSSVVILLTVHNKENVAVPFHITPDDHVNGAPTIDLDSSVTVEQWLDMVDAAGGSAYTTASGAEFAAELSRTSSFSSIS